MDTLTKPGGYFFCLPRSGHTVGKGIILPFTTSVGRQKTEIKKGRQVELREKQFPPRLDDKANKRKT